MDNQDHKEFGPLLEKMKVVDSKGESQMDEDQWEAASKSFPSLRKTTDSKFIFLSS